MNSTICNGFVLNIDYTLEESICKYLLNQDENNALKTYKELIKLSNLDLSNIHTLRNLKDYLICLNVILNQHIIKYCYDKKEIRKVCCDFVYRIEKENCINKLLHLGEIIIKEHIKLLISNQSNVVNSIVKEAIIYINNNFDQTINLETISNKVHVNKSYLSMLFYKNTGYKFTDYVNLIRIKKSKDLLINSSESILDIALSCGFNTQNYFCQVFKKHTNLTPIEYRNSIKSLPAVLY